MSSQCDTCINIMLTHEENKFFVSQMQRLSPVDSIPSPAWTCSRCTPCFTLYIKLAAQRLSLPAAFLDGVLFLRTGEAAKSNGIKDNHNSGLAWLQLWGAAEGMAWGQLVSSNTTWKGSTYRQTPSGPSDLKTRSLLCNSGSEIWENV